MRGIWVSIVAAAALAGCGETPDPLTVTLEFELRSPEQGPTVIEGKTNLPPGTTLHASLEEVRPSGGVRNGVAVVAADGTFRTDPLVKDAPPSPGVYVARVVMPIALRQSDDVRLRIGQRGELLAGPLVRNGSLGGTVHSEREITVGGANAAEIQRARAAADLVRLEAVVDELEALHTATLDVTSSLVGRVAPSRTPTFREFSKRFVERVADLDRRLREIELSTNSVSVRGAFDGVLRTHNEIVQGNPQKFQSESRQAKVGIEQARRSLDEVREFAGLEARSEGARESKGPRIYPPPPPPLPIDAEDESPLPPG